MKVNYKVLAYRPEAEFIAIEFTHPDRPDEPWVKQFEFPDFTRQEKLMDQIRAVASRIAGQWERIQEHPAELAIPETGQVDVVPELYLPYEPNPQYEEAEWDHWTQELLPGDIESPTQETIPWIVRDLTPEEIEQKLDEAATAIRMDRNWALMQSDGIFAPDSQVWGEMEDWLEYRQKLRDITYQPDFPKEVDWPRRPDYKEDGSTL